MGYLLRCFAIPLSRTPTPRLYHTIQEPPTKDITPCTLVSLEAQRGRASCPRSPSQQAAELRCEPRISDAHTGVCQSWPDDPGRGRAS